jgi:tetratricopeptide (TPR) repeat protein
MPSKILKKNLKKITLLASCFLFAFIAHALAANEVIEDFRDEKLGLGQQARDYRNEGFKYQNRGDLGSALKLYQKAASIDSEYAVVHNDLGVIYEAQGDLERAQESYLKAISIDPSYASAYTNLALLYENKRELKKAVYFWEKRLELGNPDDFWTWKAGQRLEDISLILFGSRPAAVPEKDINALVTDVISKKIAPVKSSKQAAAKKPQDVKQDSLAKGYSTEMQQALEDAGKLNFQNKDIR